MRLPYIELSASHKILSTILSVAAFEGTSTVEEIKLHISRRRRLASLVMDWLHGNIGAAEVSVSIMNGHTLSSVHDTRRRLQRPQCYVPIAKQFPARSIKSRLRFLSQYSLLMYRAHFLPSTFHPHGHFQSVSAKLHFSHILVPWKNSLSQPS